MLVQVCRCADRVVCVSKDSAALRIREGIPREEACTVWNGVDLSRFAYLGPEAKGPAVLVARLSPEKDVETLLRATALVIEELPAFRLKIARSPATENVPPAFGKWSETS
jgi:glycosyltransferase involved in cell wall biosynthesis